MVMVNEAISKLDALLSRSRNFHEHLKVCEHCQYSVFMFCDTGKTLFAEMDANALPGPLSTLDDGSFSDERTATMLDQCEQTVTLTEITDELLGKYRQ